METLGGRIEFCTIATYQSTAILIIIDCVKILDSVYISIRFGYGYTGSQYNMCLVFTP